LYSNEMKITPQITPTKKQELAWDKWMDDTTRFIVFGGGAGGGKSWVGCEMILTGCYFYPGSSWFLARNELKRLMNTTYKTWLKVCKHHKIPDTDWKLDGQYNVIKFNNGSEVHLLDVSYKPTDPLYERFGSYEFTGGFGDEINEWEFDAYDVLKSRIGRNNKFETKEGTIEVPPKFFGACNPAKNWVYQEFYKPWRDNTMPPEKAFIQSLYSDNPHTAEMYGEQLASIKNVINRQRLMQGLWEYTDDISSLVTYTTLSDMFGNAPQTTGTMYAVFDVSRGGNDKAIANIFDGWHSIERVEVPKTDDPQELRESVREILVSRKIAYRNALYDDNGIGWALGGGELKGMRQFVGSRSPLPTKVQIQIKKKNRLDPNGEKPNFNNLKSQCGFYLANKVNNHEVSVTDKNDKDIIIEDLTALLVEKDIEKEGKQQLRPKEDVKEDLGRSPDHGDTFIMRAWFDLFDGAVGDDEEEKARVSDFYKKLEMKAKIRTKKEGVKAGLR
jgi:phage terminase large subunit